MEPRDYPTFVADRFAPDPARRALSSIYSSDPDVTIDIDETLKSLSFKFNILHVGIGIAGEACEYMLAQTPEHKLEELGDCLFYFQAGMNLLSLNVPSPISSLPPFLNFLELANDFLDQCKKLAIYGQSLDLSEAFFNAWSGFTYTLAVNRLTLETVQAHNINKLTARYATTFTTEESQARRDKDATRTPNKSPRRSQRR